jgi:hypothetical protein
MPRSHRWFYRMGGVLIVVSGVVLENSNWIVLQWNRALELRQGEI